jgi:cell division transport system permease protein
MRDSGSAFGRWWAAVVILFGLLAAGAVGCTSTPSASTPTTSAPTPTKVLAGDLVTIVVFLRADATASQKAAIQVRLRVLPGLGRLYFRTRAESYAEFKDIFKDSPDVVAQTKLEDVPESFWLTLADQAAEPIMADLRRLPGVEDVSRAQRTFPTPIQTH